MNDVEGRKILIADDDKDIVELVELLLNGEGYETITAFSGREAVEKADETVDLIILDIMMPDLNGIMACREIRKNYRNPILFLSAMSNDSDKSTAFLSGGDDYLVKPFSSVELVARVKSLLRRFYVYRGAVEDDPEIIISPHLNEKVIFLNIDGEVTVNGEAVKLTYTEYEILNLLVEHRGSIVSLSDIYEKIWAETYNKRNDSTVMVHIQNLRGKIEQDPKRPKIIKTAWGKGYYIERECIK